MSFDVQINDVQMCRWKPTQIVVARYEAISELRESGNVNRCTVSFLIILLKILSLGRQRKLNVVIFKIFQEFFLIDNNFGKITLVNLAFKF